MLYSGVYQGAAGWWGGGRTRCVFRSAVPFLFVCCCVVVLLPAGDSEFARCFGIEPSAMSGLKRQLILKAAGLHRRSPEVHTRDHGAGVATDGSALPASPLDHQLGIASPPEIHRSTVSPRGHHVLRADRRQRHEAGSGMSAPGETGNPVLVSVEQLGSVSSAVLRGDGGAAKDWQSGYEAKAASPVAKVRVYTYRRVDTPHMSCVVSWLEMVISCLSTA